MPIVESDIQFRLSGGAANADPNLSLGGIMSATAIVSGVANNLFDNVKGDESEAGSTEYRCIYGRHAHATLPWQAVVAWILANTTSPDDDIEIGLDPAGNGDGVTTGVATTIPNETTAPDGVNFTKPATKVAGLSVNSLTPGQGRAIWVKRVVSPGASALTANSATIRLEGDTAS